MLAVMKNGCSAVRSFYTEQYVRQHVISLFDILKKVIDIYPKLCYTVY